jgi:hypothetical protein
LLKLVSNFLFSSRFSRKSTLTINPKQTESQRLDCLAQKCWICSSVMWLTTCSTSGLRFPAGSRIFSSPQRPDRLWGPWSLVCNLFPRWWIVWSATTLSNADSRMLDTLLLRPFVPS